MQMQRQVLRLLLHLVPPGESHLELACALWRYFPLGCNTVGSWGLSKNANELRERGVLFQYRAALFNCATLPKTHYSWNGICGWRS
jgi:hypothetical protein